ncbi:MAG: protein kinase, partial [Candidatus Acidiferrales bacterium]
MIGQTLSHYRIVQKIGAGGMGEVYRAHDEQLDRDVALKVLPAGTLADEAARRQFRKEALALAKLNHPNIETVHEFGTQDCVDFLAMELITGSSLSEKLKEGPLPEREIVRLGTQFAEGLAVAHEHGVVHRDLKPGNLMITSEGRLKILDFGLARLVHATADPDMTQSIAQETGTVTGTVPYMSPEQLRGESVDARSDIFSAGAVLYEMATGQRPFPQTQGPQLMGAILHQAPASPRSLNPAISLGLESVILKALEKDRSQRFQSTRELRGTLEGLSASAAPIAEHKRSGRRLIAGAAGALLIVLLVGLMFGLNLGGLRERLLHRGSAENNSASLPSAPIHPRRSVAVIGFKNLSGRSDEAWLSTALSEMMTTELAAGDQLRTIPGESVAHMKVDISLKDEESYAPATLTIIRRNIGSDYVVLGSYLVLGDAAAGQLRLDLRLQDTTTGLTLAVVSVKGKEADLDDLVNNAGAELRAKLGVSEVTPAEVAGIKGSLPSNRESARYYSEGLMKLRVFDDLAARDLLRKAVALDPKFALAHAFLAGVWGSLGYDQRAQDEARKAYELSTNLSREDRLSIGARYYEAMQNWDKAIETYKALFDFFPDNLEYGLRLANVEIAAAKPKDALAIVEDLHKLPAPTGEDPRIDGMAAAVQENLGDFKQEAELSAKEVEKARAAGARLLIAHGLYSESWAYHSLGQPKPAMDTVEEARRIYEVAGDRRGVANVLSIKGNILSGQGDLAGADKLYDQVMAIDREAGFRHGMAATLNNKAILAYMRGDLKQAKVLWEQGSTVLREIDDKSDAAKFLSNIASVVDAEGDFAGARRTHERVLAMFREVGNQSGIASELGSIGSTLIEEGDLVEGKRVSQESLELSQKIGDKGDEVVALLSEALAAIALGNLPEAMSLSQKGLNGSEAMSDKHSEAYARLIQAQVFELQGNLSAAQNGYEESLKLRKDAGERGAAAESQLALARLLIEEGHPDDAEKQIGDAREEFRRENQLADEIGADVLLARSLLTEGKIANAEKEISGARHIVGTS